MMKLPFGLILASASSLAIAAAGKTVDQAVADLHDRYGDDLAPISAGLIADTSMSGDAKLEVVISTLVAAAAKDGITVIYALAKAVAHRVYLGVVSGIHTAAEAVVSGLKALAHPKAAAA
jgi:hypothetical protein